MTETAKQVEFDDLPPLYKLVLSYVPYGAVNAISAKKLAKACGVNERTVIGVVYNLRLLGFLIGSSKGKNSGYFKISNIDEAMQTLRMLQHQYQQTGKIIAAFEQSIFTSGGRFTEQPTLDTNHAEQLNLDI